MRPGLFLLVSMTALSACSSDYGDGGFACTSGVCPSGYVCVDENGSKICRKSGTPAGDKSTAVDRGVTVDTQLKTEAPPPDPCQGKPDGTDCSPTGATGFICRSSKCVASSCSDGFVDTENGEDCDDGNTVPDDGCNACKFGCETEPDCDDKNPCTGPDHCDTGAHKCQPAQAVTDGTNCPMPPPSAAIGSCNGGVCAPKGCGNKIKEGTEECDDGNKIDGDGCNNDCTLSCHGDTDCDDKDKCTGVETCDPVKHACVAGTPLKCDDSLTCNTDSCDPVLGCQNVALDADKDGHGMAPCGDDCNDNDPSMHPGLIDCVDLKDNDCNGVTDPDPNAKGICWQDVDGDGYAPVGAATAIGCTCPTGYVNKDPTQAGNADCVAKLSDVHPAQAKYFTASYCKSGCIGAGCLCKVGDWSYDYNCSGTEEQQYKSLAGICTKCVGSSLICLLNPCSGSGWVGATVPACGTSAKYQTCTDKTGTNCTATVAIRNQACH